MLWNVKEAQHASSKWILPTENCGSKWLLGIISYHASLFCSRIGYL